MALPKLVQLLASHKEPKKSLRLTLDGFDHRLSQIANPGQFQTSLCGLKNVNITVALCQIISKTKPPSCQGLGLLHSTGRPDGAVVAGSGPGFKRTIPGRRKSTLPTWQRETLVPEITRWLEHERGRTVASESSRLRRCALSRDYHIGVK